MDELLRQILNEIQLLKSDVSQIKSKLDQLQADTQINFNKMQTELQLLKQSQSRTQQDVTELQKGMSEMAVLQDYIVREAGKHNADIHLLRHHMDVVRTQIESDDE